eukprot:TRINITY_DN5437_c0_g1_i6.p1 TRINITY_DN5437_c0_g1~~TRINITY_DN5437_c0_g1_i6.p1  ORF type:complete len:614 (+),score=118.31 TRINITY_DN5437_c0_g1_i6:20-1861(+)
MELQQAGVKRKRTTDSTPTTTYHSNADAVQARLDMLTKRCKDDSSTHVHSISVDPLTTPFPHPFTAGEYGEGATLRTLYEMRMSALSASIRSKPDWVHKANDPTICAKWTEEALAARFDRAQIDYVIAEARDYYTRRRDGSCEVSEVDGVWQDDACIDAQLKALLVREVDSLQQAQDEGRDGGVDWHPGSGGQVRDIVHPSLFCNVYQRTQMVSSEPSDENESDVQQRNRSPFAFIGKIDTPTCAPDSNRRVEAVNQHGMLWRFGETKMYSTSNKHQWLPSEFHVDAETGKVSIESYINNLHPFERIPLYRVLARVFERFVPLFENVLTDLRHPMPVRLNVDPYNWYPPRDKDGDEDDEDDEDDYFASRIPMQLTAPEYAGPRELPSKPVQLRGCKLQVIVKLANIELTPEKPSYAGGVWHVEGMLNERIVASGIYYYQSTNISESRLRFRAAVSEPNYEQNDNQGVRAIYGLSDGDGLNQELGSVETKEDRCIAFPNLYQHQVAPFHLADPTRPGQRRILVFFLVDPTQRVLSTSDVPPQQRDWLLRHLAALPPFNRLPVEIIHKHIAPFIEWPMSMDEAKEHRDELMTERKYFVAQNNEQLFEREFSLCEH